MKEQTRNTEVQINEEEIGKLPEKEFRIMIVKMIKNLEKNGENARINQKDLEELKNTHAETNNTITQVKNILEGLNSKISEAKERNSELEVKMVEITSEKQNKVKRMKRTEDSLRPVGRYQMHQHSNYRGPRRRKEKEKVKNEEIIVEILQSKKKRL